MKTLIVLAPERFRDEEYEIPRRRLEGSGVSVTVAGSKPGTYTGMFGMRVEPDMILDDVVVDDFDAVVVVGGSGSKDFLWGDLRLAEIVREAYEKDKVVAAICLSTVVLAKAGILRGKRATVFPTTETVKILEWNEVEYVKEHVVVDGSIITADGPESAGEFAEKIFEALPIKEV